MPAIKFEHVSKRYRVGSSGGLRDALPALYERLIGSRNNHRPANEFIWALKDVSFEVDKGETLGIIGRNGAGKTTILKLLSTITRPTSGHVQVNGRTSALIELGAGFHPDLTGRENTYLNASILGLTKREVDAKLDDIVAFAELEPFIDTPVKRYSSGMYVRLGFSVAAHADPDVLLVDEVLSVGDIMFREKCRARIRDFQKAGKSIVFVSHNLVLVQKVCSRAIWLDKGRIASEGNPQEVVNDYTYRQMRDRADVLHSAPSEIPLRYGTGEAEIERVRILDHEGRERDFFEPGEEIVLQIDYHAFAKISPVNFLAIVTDNEGLKLCGTDFAREKFDGLKSIEGRGSVRCRFRKLPLRPGTYFLIAIIEDSETTLDQRRMIGPFIIKPHAEEEYVDPWRYGLVDPQAHWTVDF
jgi:ABC-type polysaccharide/polyol phosphate transport system ATPase subunit